MRGRMGASRSRCIRFGVSPRKAGFINSPFIWMKKVKLSPGSRRKTISSQHCSEEELYHG